MAGTRVVGDVKETLAPVLIVGAGLGALATKFKHFALISHCKKLSYISSAIIAKSSISATPYKLTSIFFES